MSISNEQRLFVLENLGFLLGKSCHIKDRLLDQHLMPEDITSTQAKVLFQIYHFRFDRPSQIGKSLNVDNSAITRMLDRLEKKGLLLRVPDPSDRRSIVIQLTESGVDVVKRSLPLARSAIDELTQALSEEEIEQLRHCLKKIVTSAITDSCREKFLKGSDSE
ncbi:DNA-binding transcriptional regulator, MarR family [Vibrio xiamenensis]|uniref:DNA-binding transcriptional regulator, MarR family n=1 Tax=Vibrio xiamenensis TaxID=861298 RepID=A0A1G7XM25_9VIBR|nr:MarR family transcriptional regulator [Vibrio xiamenensis]SDG85245.1 DNA-binding transcriptional regulator, MarR family [Vibrio xiamenensis]